MKKSEALESWKRLPEGQNPLRHMIPVPYKTTGSKYGACGIRIDGTPAFVDAVLSRLKPLLDGENHVTRLELARRPVECRLEFGGKVKTFDNVQPGGEVCYIRLHERGHEGCIASSIFDRNLDGATREYDRAVA